MSDSIIQHHQDYIFPAVSRYYGDYPMIADRAKDQYLWDVDGKQYLDFFGGVLTVSVGHCNEYVTARTEEQLKRLQHTTTLYINPIMVELAEKLAQITPNGVQKSMFVNSGSEANETAILAARMYTGNQEVLALRHGYSGRSILAMSLTAHSTWRMGTVTDPYIRHVRNPYAYRMPPGIDPDKFLDFCVQEVEEAIATTTKGKIAAFIAEPIQGVGGFIIAPEDYFKRVVPIVHEAGGVFICDEVQTAWGRTGDHMFGISHWDVEPDIMTFAKGMANGSPIGATIARPEIADAMQGKMTFSTFGGNPVTMATAMATIEYIEQNNLPHNAKVQGDRFRANLEELQSRHPMIGDVRGMGLMQGLEIIQPDTDKEPDAAMTNKLLAAIREKGLLVGKGGLYGNVIRMAPHLNVTAEDIDIGSQMLADAFASV